MEKRKENPSEGPHDQPPQDEVTKNKIDKHLSDINDTISEEDIKNIKTGSGEGVAEEDHQHDIDEADEIINDSTNEDEEPDKEAPSSWEILGD